MELIQKKENEEKTLQQEPDSISKDNGGKLKPSLVMPYVITTKKEQTVEQAIRLTKVEHSNPLELIERIENEKVSSRPDQPTLLCTFDGKCMVLDRAALRKGWRSLVDLCDSLSIHSVTGDSTRINGKVAIKLAKCENERSGKVKKCRPELGKAKKCQRYFMGGGCSGSHVGMDKH